jgi:hypothetical protein
MITLLVTRSEKIAISIIIVFLAIALSLLLNHSQKEKVARTAKTSVIAKQSAIRQNRKFITSSSSINKKYQQLSDLVAKWSIYKNEKHGFKLKYPRNLELKETSNQQNFLRMTSLELRDKVYGDRVFYIRATDLGWEFFMPLIHHARLVKGSERKVLIDGAKGYQVKIKDLPRTKYITVERNNVLYEFIGEGKLFDQVLATFEFIEVIKSKQKRVSFVRPTVEALPEKVRNWVKNSLKFDMTRFANVMESDGKQYLFVSSGIRDSVGSHLVEITDVVIMEQEEVVVKTKFTKLPPARPAIQVPDNPYDLVYIEATGLPVRFVPTGDDTHIPITSLTGIDHLPTIVAQSRRIKVFNPAPNEIVDRKFNVSGVANVFEATIVYRLFDTKQNKLVEGFTTATATVPHFIRAPVIPSSTINWGYFTLDLEVPKTVAVNTKLILELYWESPKDGTVEDLVVIPLKLGLR